MDGQELIQVNLQLPSSALDSLSRLAEQLRKLTAAVSGLPSGAGMPEEAVESGFFDPERFLALRHKAEEAAGQDSQAAMAEAQAVSAEVLEQVQEPESTGWTEPAEGPALEEDSPRKETSLPEPASQAAESAAEDASEEIPSARPETEAQVPDAPVVQMEPESQIPEAEDAWTRMEEREIPLSTAQAEPPAGVETPLGAGAVVTAEPEASASRWTGVTEELVTAGPAPLTAEAVSLAFQRDGRRYDNGFPLY